MTNGMNELKIFIMFNIKTNEAGYTFIAQINIRKNYRYR